MVIPFRQEPLDYRAELRAQAEELFGPCSVWRTAGLPDILMFAPNASRQDYVVMTCGLGEGRMDVNGEVEARAEFMLKLDSRWPVADVHDPEAVWPVILLGNATQFVLQGGWVSPGHVLQLSHVLPGTSFSHVVVSPPLELNVETFVIGTDRVALYALIPAFFPEIQYVQGRPLGGLTLISRFMDAGVTECVVRERAMVVSAAEQVQRVFH